MQKITLFLIILFVSGCVVQPEEIKKFDEYCKLNGGGKWIDKTWIIVIDPPKYVCNNGAQFQ